MGSIEALTTTNLGIIQLLFFLSSLGQTLYIYVHVWASLENSFQVSL